MFGKKKSQSRYQGRNVLVIGGANGMGLMTAQRLGERGANLIIADIAEDALSTACTENPSWHARTIDVSEPESCRETVSSIEEEFGPLYRVTTSAAIAPGRLFLEDSAESFSRVMRVNVEGISNVAHAIVPKMVERDEGEFVVFGSVAGEMLTPGLSAYCTSKAAVNAYMEILAWELRDSNVVIHCARPPGVKTSLLDQMVEGTDGGMISLGLERDIFAEPAEIVDAIERAVDKKQSLSFPHASARAIHLLRRASPRLTWWLIGKSE